MSFIGTILPSDSLRTALREAYLRDEAEIVAELIDEAALSDAQRGRVERTARELVERVRAQGKGEGGLDAFLQEYSLTSREGVVLMCLAEALLRIPDAETADRLIRDKMTDADWKKHLGRSQSILVNASTWGLMLTGRVIRLDDGEDDMAGLFGRVIARSGEPVIRQAMTQAMRIMGRQFVMGRTIGEALERAADGDAARYRHSFDMLGEAALTAADAARYDAAYRDAIQVIGAAAGERSVSAASGGRAVDEAPGISVKLSALHPRYEVAQRERVLAELVPRLRSLAVMAKEAGIGLTVDAEEAARLDLSLDVIEAVFSDPALGDWGGFGLAVQAYQRRAPNLLDWLIDLARRTGRQMTVRLVKGAYWDSEIKRGQEIGLSSYPVFTRKSSTDVAYLACAKRLFAASDVIYPQFATHNAHTTASIIELSGGKPFEFQRLHGMGEALYGLLIDDFPCRVYAPVGSHEDLLPYLVRRLLENGANTSFVNRLSDADAPVEEIIADPVSATAALTCKPHPRIPAPRDMLGAVEGNIPGDGRKVARGLDLTDPLAVAALKEDMARAMEGSWRAAPHIDGVSPPGEDREATDPADRRRVVGAIEEADAELAARAVGAAKAAAGDWDRAGGAHRADCLERAADMMEADMARLMALAVREGGKTLPDAVAEVREAVDFLRYYAAAARRDFAGPQALPGPTGERNEMTLHGRGVFVCISPWNFPLAIFTGQVAAALAAGNAVIAKPAEQTPLIAAEAVRLMHRAGVPESVLHFLPGRGETVGAALVANPRIDGVVFTGSTETAQAINRTLAARTGPIIPLIAETGGQNAMIVDSSALTEQVVTDVVTSAFRSAGQRCSALRVLFLQDDIADKTLTMLGGAMEELVIGDPGLLATDVGPVIDEDARGMLERHSERMEAEATLLYRCPLPAETAHGTFFAPVAFEIDGIGVLEREVFGPVLHVVRYAADRLDDVLESIRETGYGLTLGIHSRIDDTVEYIRSRMRVGNVYVNRSIIGAVVGVQPFGGEGLSGTGPKAGGPHYLHRFAVERALTVNTVAMGGNASLLTLGDEG